MSAADRYFQPSPSEYNDARIEAVITCVNYGDFLHETLPVNLPHFDKVVVVTTAEDTLTRAVCKKWSVDTIITTAFTEGGAQFNKGHAINVGIGALRQRGWIMHLDADIVLPLTFRNMLGKSALMRNRLYGCERANVTGFARWRRLRSQWFGSPQFTSRYIMSTDADLPIGANVVHKEHGYVPIGFFQLWHSQHAHQHDLRYPDNCQTAEQSDVQWAIRWPREDRLLLPTFRAYHLESPGAGFGANWDGRTTAPFTCTGKPLTIDQLD